jgi:hypothetical protein
MLCFGAITVASNYLPEGSGIAILIGFLIRGSATVLFPEPKANNDVLQATSYGPSCSNFVGSALFCLLSFFALRKSNIAPCNSGAMSRILDLVLPDLVVL